MGAGRVKKKGLGGSSLMCMLRRKVWDSCINGNGILGRIRFVILNRVIRKRNFKQFCFQNCNAKRVFSLKPDKREVIFKKCLSSSSARLDLDMLIPKLASSFIFLPCFN